MNDAHTGETIPLNGHTRAVDPQTIPLIKGRPTRKAEERQGTYGWGYASILPRTRYRDYRAREGGDVYETLRIMRDLDPDAAQAVDTFQLFCLQGYEHTAVLADGKTQDVEGTALLRDLDARVGTEYGGGADQLLGVYLMSLFTDGAFAGEIEPTPDLRDIVDVHPIVPTKLSFKREKTTDRLMLGIMVGRDFIELSPRQVRYLPYQPDVGNPYGRPMLLPAIAPILQKVEFLLDLRDVLRYQAWPRKDIAVAEEALLAAYATPGMTAEQRQNAVMTAFAEIQRVLLAADPTQDLVHLDSVTIKAFEVANGLPDLDSVMATLDSQITNGLHILNVFLNRNSGTTTTHATVQARAFALKVAAIQRMLKRFWEWVGNTRLQLAGRQSRSSVQFELLQVVDRLLEANAESTETNTWVTQVQQGWATANEAAQALLGHDAVGQPAPAPDVADRTDAADEPPPDDATDEEVAE